MGLKICITSLFVLFSNMAMARDNGKQLLEKLEHLEGEEYVEGLIDLLNYNTKLHADSLYKYSFVKDYFNELQKAAKWVEENEASAHKEQVHFYLFYYYNAVRDYPRAIFYGKKVIGSKNIDLPLYDMFLGDLAYIYQQSHLYVEFFELMKLRRKLAEESNVREFSYVDFSQMGLIYYRMKQYENAIHYYKRSIHVDDTVIYNLSNASTLNNIGLCYKELSEMDSANYYFSKAIKTLNNLSDVNNDYNQYFKDVVKSNRAKLKMAEDNYKYALPYIFTEIQGALRFGEYWNAISGYNYLAYIYINRKQPDEAIKNLSLAFELIKEYGYFKYYVKSYELQGRALLLLGAVDEANMAFSNSKRIADSLQAADTKHRIETASIIYETNKKESELLKKSMELSEMNQIVLEQSRSKQLLQYGLMTSMVFISIIAFFFYQINKSRRALKEQREKLANSLTQKELLLKEIHHRVKNNLQIVSGLLHLQANQTSNTEVLAMIQTGQRRIESMSLIHQMLYATSEFKSVKIRTYLEQLVQSINQGYSHSAGIKVNLEMKDLSIDIDKVIALGLITNELLTNAYKYAFNGQEGKIDIRLEHLNNGEYLFKFSDNGKGLPIDFNHTKCRSLGTKLIMMLSDELKGQASYESNGGTHFNLKLKLDIK